MFLTWRLWGTLPLRVNSTGCTTAGHAFAVQDRTLDRGAVGPQWLRNPHIANLVAEAILIGQDERRFYELCAWVVMPNHVHLLLLPQVPLPVLTRWLKGSTARSANQILGRTGQPFWQDESFDHYLRSSEQTGRLTAYIEGNPISAGLARSAECWPWSRAGWQAKPPAPPNLPGDRAKM
jgi:REP element-mobilizing transposase RayT